MARQRLAQDAAISKALSEGVLAQSKALADWQKIVTSSLVSQMNQAVSLGLAAQTRYPTDLAKLFDVGRDWSKIWDVQRAALANVENVQKVVSELARSITSPQADVAKFAALRLQLQPTIAEIEEADEETLAALVEENLLAEPEDESSPIASEAKTSKSFFLTRQQKFLIAWLIVILMALPSAIDYQGWNQKKAEDTSLFFALNVAAGLTLWRLLTENKD